MDHIDKTINISDDKITFSLNRDMGAEQKLKNLEGVVLQGLLDQVNAFLASSDFSTAAPTTAAPTTAAPTTAAPTTAVPTTAAPTTADLNEFRSAQNPNGYKKLYKASKTVEEDKRMHAMSMQNYYRAAANRMRMETFLAKQYK